MLDSKSMFEHLNGDKESGDSFIQNRAYFISQIVEQRKINVECHLIDAKDNLAHRLLD